MFIKIAGLKEGIHDYSFSGEVAELGLTAPFYGNYTLQVKLDKSVHQLLLSAGLEVQRQFTCDRCGADFNRQVQSAFKVFYIFGSRPDGADDENIIYLPLEADKIDISAEVYDFANLAVPMKALCSEECKGLCARCGKDLNFGDCGCSHDDTDPRWLPLLELKKKMNNN